MRRLFEIDLKDYDVNAKKIYRPSARAIIIKDDKIALVYSKKFHYYKFPGGGIKDNEDNIDALIREVKEEVGLNVIKESIKEYGSVLRKQKGKEESIFIQENYYYTCDITSNQEKQNLDDYESDAKFVLRIVNIDDAIKENSAFHSIDSFDEIMIKREEKVLRIIKEELYKK